MQNFNKKKNKPKIEIKIEAVIKIKELNKF